MEHLSEVNKFSPLVRKSSLEIIAKSTIPSTFEMATLHVPKLFHNYFFTLIPICTSNFQLHLNFLTRSFKLSTDVSFINLSKMFL